MRFVALIPFLASAACIDPLVADDVDRSRLFLPAGSVVPHLLEVEPSRRFELSRLDGLPDEAPDARLFTAFVEGKEVLTWNLGPVSPTPIPLYLLVSESDTPDFETPRGDFSPIGHLPIFDAIPGDPAYSPFWTVVLVPVTDRYEGQLLTSFEAVEAALKQGLVAPPIPLEVAINCPVVLPESRLELPDGSFAPPKTAYYKGTIVTYFDFDTVAIDPKTGQIPVARVFELRREGAEPVSEPIRAVDFTGDGDLFDTNDLFEAGRGDPAYTGLVWSFDTIVRSDVSTLDVAPDDPGLTRASALWLPSGQPDPAVVVALYPRNTVMNRPIAAPAAEEP